MTKKLKSMLCTVLMICTMTLPQLAYAAPSAPVEPPEANQSIEQVEGNEDLLGNGSEVKTSEQDSSLPSLSVAKYVVSGVALVIGGAVLIVLKKKSK